MKRNVKNIMMSCILCGLVAAGIEYAIPERVLAAPFVTIDYGEYRGSIHHWWDVDLGSIQTSGNETKVTVNLDNEHNTEGARVYHFKYNKDHWNYKYDTWTGKGDFREGFVWNHVSSSKLANDVLYIVQNH